ncbi:cell division protein FtsQ/DivIB [Erythrobacter sp. JK5]|uniref:cell division protein FtsQ/DivIB n=1 Tax=Erythrobacter sp. JK5 TaxID=2829500 RepID=UPI001BAAA4C3|nr:FtsQ-type POTRA domain-containing protein [Erythrobacter sp. JK5]QUL36543.1 FtsQ-type POTRA domain-containing protein [Erythrobacter sp. JK5]
MARIKRGGQGVRRAAKASNRAAGARRARAKTSGFIDGAMSILPFTEEQWSRIWLAAIIGGAVALAWVIANLAGVPAMAHAQVALLASDAGFEVRHVRVTGTSRMDERQVYARALAQRDQPMPQVDVEALRAELLELPWVADARVSVQLPETLAIDIIERTPHAVLEKPDRLMLIDASGVELEPIARDKAGERLRISGPGAAKQVPALETLLDAVPALRPQVEAAEWVGNRRWNLTFKTGQVLALPEGADESASALVKFARIDGQNRLIGGKVATFDMRAPPRIYMRVPGRGDRIEFEGANP